jgi:hypothetical protein
VVVIGILFEVVSPGTTSRCYAVNFRHRISNGTAMTFLIIFLVCVAAVIVSGNLNRAGAFNVILELFFSVNSEAFGAIAKYRADVYNVWGIRQVIGNYAGAVFGAFFALILFTHFYMNSRRTGRFGPKIIAIAIIAFPIAYAIGSGSRLMLLRTLLIYFVFAALPYGLRLLDWKNLQIGALIFALLVMSTTVLERGVQGETFAENMVIQTEKSVARLFLGKGGSTMAVYEYYPNIESFERGIPILEKLLGTEIDEEPTVALKIFSYLTSGSLGTAGPQTFGDVYASFGYPGQLFLTPLLAMFLLSLRMLYRRTKEKNTLDRALWAFLIVSIGYTGYSDLASFKAIGFVYVLFIYLVLRFVAVGLNGTRGKRFDRGRPNSEHHV